MVGEYGSNWLGGRDDHYSQQKLIIRTTQSLGFFGLIMTNCALFSCSMGIGRPVSARPDAASNQDDISLPDSQPMEFSTQGRIPSLGC